MKSIIQNLIRALTLTLLLAKHIYATGAGADRDASPPQSCQCQTVTSWTDLQIIIREANKSPTGGIVEVEQKKVILCPFSIEKIHDATTNHWKHFIPIKKPMHIVCQKHNPGEACVVDVVGPTCRPDQNCGKQLFKIKSDDVFIEGIMFRNAKDNIVHVDPGVRNAKLIDFEIYGSYAPGGKKTSIDGLIVTAPDSSLQILRGRFKWNFATVLYNRGDTVVYDTQFKANRNRRADSKGTAIYNRMVGVTTIVSSSFENNVSENGPAIYAVEGGVMDAGMNCASKNTSSKEGSASVDCDGIEFENGSCKTFKTCISASS
uniref:Pectate lyase n=1 Tax=Chaetoceros debilis TaxID=122233 RepID=A0A7S3QFX5_9STRA|eukprot:CAMPEP_0194108762 /NCGR_PEP_ID=MMETSP0150-20130528/8403_1 /TAXON_ID=122233 /ORGANISM="Chaetoceros debilis, Strain MM31A-1" /LENGTH=317 /DNA_ID=CAMNT_0038797543 /DNA_START=200 /DNA_END=1153 /DNA_ORIENTATION=+